MPAKKYKVTLTKEEREELTALVNKGKGQATLIKKVTAWKHERNASTSTVRWRFTTEDACIKLHILYPSISVC